MGTNKGYIKLYRSEADITKLWENNALFAVYQKLKIVALWPEGTINRPSRVLAKQLAISRNTLRKALEGLQELGLVWADITDKNTLFLRVVYAEQDPWDKINAPENGPKPARGVNLLNQPKQQTEPVLGPTAPAFTDNAAADYPTPAPGGVGSKNEPPATLGQNLSHLGSKFEPKVGQNLSHLTLYRNNKIESNNTNPHYPPTQLTDNGFTTFWDAYPNKKGKQPAFKKWQSGQYDLSVILPVLEKQKKLRRWVKDNGQYIPHAKTYLHQKRYEDVLPTGEEHYILDFKEPKTEREIVLRVWLEKTNPELLENDNQKINSTLETERALFEQLIVKCKGDVEKAYGVMRHGWKMGCTTLRGILERAGSYLTDLEDK